MDIVDLDSIKEDYISVKPEEELPTDSVSLFGSFCCVCGTEVFVIAMPHLRLIFENNPYAWCPRHAKEKDWSFMQREAIEVYNKRCLEGREPRL